LISASTCWAADWLTGGAGVREGEAGGLGLWAGARLGECWGVRGVADRFGRRSGEPGRPDGRVRGVAAGIFAHRAEAAAAGEAQDLAVRAVSAAALGGGWLEVPRWTR
jgi:hypothetical protein